MRKRFAVVGGSSVDIFATSAFPLSAQDSNPGTVNIGFGGVGRNIAENLAHLEQDVYLVAPFGQDPLSEPMLRHTAGAGVNTEHCLVVPSGRAPYYIAVNEPGGEMSVAVNDMLICDQITPAFLAQKLSMLNGCDGVIVDTNIPGESIAYLASHCTTPLFAESVSTNKARKLIAVLPHLFAMQANLQEAQSLLGTEIAGDIASLRHAANRFHTIGIPHVLITLGKRGAFYSAQGTPCFRKAFPTRTVNANGCGDAFCAAAFLGILQKSPPEELLQNALCAAAIAAQSVQAVSAAMSEQSIRNFLHESRNEP